MDTAELDRADIELKSLLSKCESAVSGGRLSPSRMTLMANRIEALRTAIELVEQERVQHHR